jgi:hypothetical protein
MMAGAETEAMVMRVSLAPNLACAIAVLFFFGGLLGFMITVLSVG